MLHICRYHTYIHTYIYKCLASKVSYIRCKSENASIWPCRHLGWVSTSDKEPMDDIDAVTPMWNERLWSNESEVQHSFPYLLTWSITLFIATLSCLFARFWLGQSQLDQTDAPVYVTVCVNMTQHACRFLDCPFISSSFSASMTKSAWRFLLSSSLSALSTGTNQRMP